MVKRRTVLVAVVTVVGLSYRAPAQPEPTSRPTNLCERKAASQAFSELVVRLLRLPMTDRQTVTDWIGSRTSVDLALRRTAYDLRETRVLSTADAGLCRVEVSVVVSELARSWARRLHQEALVGTEELEEIRQWSFRAERRRLSASGTARGAERRGDAADMPAGWEHLPAEALACAREAAAADAAERLRVRCRELRLSSTESLGDVFDLYGALEDAFLRRLQEGLGGEGVYDPVGVCRLPVSLSAASLGDLLSKAAADVSAAARFPKMQFDGLAALAPAEPIAVEGVGIPPPPRLAWPGRRWAAETPTWATETLTAIGRGRPGRETDEEGPEVRQQVAVGRARLDAMRNMWSQVDDLVLPDGRRVRDVILAHPELAEDLAGLEGRMRELGFAASGAGGEVTVRLTLPLGPLWDVLSRAGSRPPATLPTTRP